MCMIKVGMVNEKTDTTIAVAISFIYLFGNMLKYNFFQ